MEQKKSKTLKMLIRKEGALFIAELALLSSGTLLPRALDTFPPLFFGGLPSVPQLPLKTTAWGVRSVEGQMLCPL